MGTASSLALAIALGACSRPTPSTPEARLAAYLAHSDPASWKLDRESFRQIVVEPYRGLYDDYAAQFDLHPPAREQLQIRRHFANDTTLSRSQVRLRWTLPVMYPAFATQETVFVEVHDEWRALAGLDAALLARVRSLAPDCADRLALAGPPGPCTDAGWVIAEAGLRGETARFEHACRLAAGVCSER